MLRETPVFDVSSLVVGIVWWLYHVPFVLFGWLAAVMMLTVGTVAATWHLRHTVLPDPQS